MEKIIDLMDVSILKLEKLLVKDRKDPIDILELYTKKVVNKDKQKKYLKNNPKLWIKKVNKKNKENNQTINSK